MNPRPADHRAAGAHYPELPLRAIIQQRASDQCQAMATTPRSAWSLTIRPYSWQTSGWAGGGRTTWLSPPGGLVLPIARPVYRMPGLCKPACRRNVWPLGEHGERLHTRRRGRESPHCPPAGRRRVSTHPSAGLRQLHGVATVGFHPVACRVGNYGGGHDPVPVVLRDQNKAC